MEGARSRRPLFFLFPRFFFFSFFPSLAAERVRRVSTTSQGRPGPDLFYGTPFFLFFFFSSSTRDIRSEAIPGFRFVAALVPFFFFPPLFPFSSSSHGIERGGEALAAVFFFRAVPPSLFFLFSFLQEKKREREGVTKERQGLDLGALSPS